MKKRPAPQPAPASPEPEFKVTFEKSRESDLYLTSHASILPLLLEMKSALSMINARVNSWHFVCVEIVRHIGVILCCTILHFADKITLWSYEQLLMHFVHMCFRKDKCVVCAQKLCWWP